MSDDRIVENKQGTGLVVASDGGLLRAHLIRKGLLVPAQVVTARPLAGPALRVDGAKRFDWTDTLQGQHERKDQP